MSGAQAGSRGAVRECLRDRPVAIEQHADSMDDRSLRQAQGLEPVESQAAAVDDPVEQVNVATDAVWLPQPHRCWYLSADVPGAGLRRHADTDERDGTLPRGRGVDAPLGATPASNRAAGYVVGVSW